MSELVLFEPHKVKGVTAIHDDVIVTDMNFDQRLMSSGIVLLSDNAKSQGIRPRWGRVYAVGPEQHEIKVGQWICVAHGRWTRGVLIDDGAERIIRKVDVNDIMLVSDTEPTDDTVSDALTGSE